MDDRRTLRPLALLALGAALLALAAAAPRGGAEPAAAPRAAVVLELFTSQGCSSCPPADRLLSRLAASPELAGRVVPLAFHVDYWNHLGWSDPFSARRWSERQERYARASGSNRIYTPQLVVDGGAECVGSREDEVRRQVERALARPPAGQVTVREARLGDKGLRVAVEARLARAVPRDLELWVAVSESGLVTRVGRGENARRTLADDFVVRRLERVGALAAAPGPPRAAAVTLPLDPAWNRGRLRVAAFLQDPQTLAIAGAGARAVE
jgi:hypothetical protein